MTPHAYIVNKRIQYGQQQLKKGISIIEYRKSSTKH